MTNIGNYPSNQIRCFYWTVMPWANTRYLLIRSSTYVGLKIRSFKAIPFTLQQFAFLPHLVPILLVLSDSRV